MVLKELILNSFYFETTVVTLKELPFLQFVLCEDVGGLRKN